MLFDGRIALITGVGRAGQVGEAIARGVAAEGARVLAVDVDRGEAEARVAELRSHGYDALGYGCDLTDEEQLRSLVATMGRDTGGKLDVLIHVAGGFAPSGPVAESDPAVWRRQFAINLTSAYLTTRAMLPALRGRGGSIVYFASAATLPGAGVKNISAYAAAKTALVTLMRAVAQEEREHGVRANAVAPDAIRTRSNIASMGDTTRYVELDAVVRAVLFLASSAASAVSGQVVPLSA